MEKIPSFQKDHNAMQPGFYESGRARGVTTFDLRFVKPNCGEYLSQSALHSIEHLLAMTLRNSERGGDIVYFGPMGCRTGFYLLTVSLERVEALALTKLCIRRALELEEVPGAAQSECGNYREHDLAAAKRSLRDYLRLLEKLPE